MRLRRSLPTGLAVLATLAAFSTLPVPAAVADTTTDTYIVQLKPGVSADKVVSKLMGSNAKVIHKVFQGGITKLTPAQAKALQSSPYVKSVHKDAVIHPTDTQLNAPWDLDMLDSTTGALDGSYTYPNSGSGVTVYVLDSGIQRSHVEFSGANIAAGYDFIAADNTTDPQDCAGHGTAVSSLIAGATLGAAKGVTLVPLKVLNCIGEGRESDIIQAADWISLHQASGTPAVANLSFGIATSDLQGDTSLDVAFQGLIDSGVTVVAAAGNGDAKGNGVDACTETPASLPDAITVAAVDIHLAETKWTNYGSCVDLYAPGELVKAATLGGTTSQNWRGTSFSAPLTSAAAAVVLHDHPTWTPAQVTAELTEQALDGVVTGLGGLPARSANKLLHVTGRFVGTAPTIVGAPYVGETQHAALHWTPTPTTLTYQWSRNGVAIDGATAAMYVATADDLGQSLTVAVTGSGAGYYDIAGTSSAVVPLAAPDPGMVVSLTPSRLMDTRTGFGATGPLHDGQTVNLLVAGVAGVSSTASAVLVNITATDATSIGYVKAYASGGAIPFTSNENFRPGQVSANLALVPVGSDGKIALTVRVYGTVQLVVDVQSFVAGGVVADAGAVVPVTPTRLKDTRYNETLSPDGILTMPVTGTAGVPADATAVFLNVTVTEPQTSGYLTVFPTGEAVPRTSNLNFVGGLTVPNMVLVKVGGDGTVSIKNASVGTSQVVVDIQGYVTAGTPTATGAVVPVSPIRIVDTRLGVGARGPVLGKSGVVVTVQSGPTGTHGLFMNFTVTETQTAGWLAAYPTAASLPLVSNLNFGGGQTVPNLVSVGLANAQVTLFNGSVGSVQMVADVFAYIL
jgi:subtilisin family serine protease